MIKIKKLSFVALFVMSFSIQAHIHCLKQAYPDQFQVVSTEQVVWKDGTVMPMKDEIHEKTAQERLENPSLFEQLTAEIYPQDFPGNEMRVPANDAGRIRNESFFKKMYGETQDQVESKLVIVYWMPHFFGDQYPLQVTTVNGVNFKFESLSRELEKWVQHHPEGLVFLADPGGTYAWRKIANTNRQSLHSFGMTIDLTSTMTEYWQDELKESGRPITEEEPLHYKNRVPLGIVKIFERHGFIWGGKWAHYDTQHFEYRPEMLCS